VLGTERAMRLRVGQFLTACMLMILHWGFVLGIARHDGFAPTPVLVWLVLTLVVYAVFYGLLRSGRSAAWADPSLTQAQVLTSLALTAASYPFLGSVRALIPGAMVIILSFGMFRLSKGLVWRAAGLGWAMLVAAVAWNPWQAGSERWYDGVVIAAALVLFGAAGFLADQLTRIRARLSAQREQLNEALARIEELAHRDALTGLFNRRFGDALLQQALTRQRRDPGQALSVVLLDLDHFKRVNDQHGHAMGDAVLQAFANAGRETFREGDTFVRWGGEEFLLVLPGTDPSAAHLALARMRAALSPALAAQGALVALGPPQDGRPAITFSAGLTAWHPGDNARALLERADRALYRAKDEGRDRVVVS
jgi:diguanylate cyclase (GGDEF)-like protein